MSEKLMPYFQEKLRQELLRRKKKNPRYSLRMFAARIGCDPSLLSKVLNGRQGLSNKVAKTILKNLPLSADQSHRFLRSVAEEAKDDLSKKLARGINVPNLRPPRVDVSIEVFKAIHELEVISILEAYGTENPSKVIQKLGLTWAEVERKTNLLLRLGLLTKKGGKIHKVARQVRFDPKLEPHLGKQYHSEVLARAKRALLTRDSGAQIANGITMVVDPARVPLVKQRCEEFLDEICDFLEQGERTEVYQIGFQIFPL